MWAIFLAKIAAQPSSTQLNPDKPNLTIPSIPAGGPQQGARRAPSPPQVLERRGAERPEFLVGDICVDICNCGVEDRNGPLGLMLDN